MRRALAYEALWAHPELRVDLLITLGSPLGMPAVFERLRPAPENGRGARPPGVRQWVDFAAAGAMIAAGRHIGDRFVGVQGGGDNRSAVDVARWEFCTAGRYLTSGTVAALRPPRP